MRGFNCTELMSAGFTVAQLKYGSFKVWEFKKYDVSAADLNGHFSAKEIFEGATSSMYSTKSLSYDIKELRLGGYSATELKQGGFNASSLRKIGVTAKDLKDVSDASELKSGGYLAKDLRDAGFTAEQVIAARYTPVELRDAGFSAQELKDANLSCSGFHESGCSAKELLSLELFSVAEMRLEGGYSATELRLADKIFCKTVGRKWLFSCGSGECGIHCNRAQRRAWFIVRNVEVWIQFDRIEDGWL